MSLKKTQLTIAPQKKFLQARNEFLRTDETVRRANRTNNVLDFDWYGNASDVSKVRFVTGLADLTLGQGEVPVGE